MNTSWSCFSVQSPRQEAHKNDFCASSVCEETGKKEHKTMCSEEGFLNPTGEMGDQGKCLCGRNI